MAWREPAPGAPMAGEREEKRASTKAAALHGLRKADVTCALAIGPAKRGI